MGGVGSEVSALQRSEPRANERHTARAESCEEQGHKHSHMPSIVYYVSPSILSTSLPCLTELLRSLARPALCDHQGRGGGGRAKFHIWPHRWGTHCTILCRPSRGGVRT